MVAPLHDKARRHRIEVRVTADQEALIRQAASLADESVSAFVFGTATARARELVEAQRTVTLPNDTFDRFYAALDEPAAIAPELGALLRAAPLPRSEVDLRRAGRLAASRRARRTADGLGA